MPKPIKLNTKHIVVILIIVSAIVTIFILSPTRQIAFGLLVLSVFLLALIAGAQTQLKTIRRMTDSPSSTIRGASQGNVELAVTLKTPENSPYFELQQKEQKGYWAFTIKKKTENAKRHQLFHSFKSHDKYLPMYEHDSVCFADLSYAEFHMHKTEPLHFKPSLIDKLAERHPILLKFKPELQDAIDIIFSEEWLPLDKKIFSIGYFSSSPSNNPPSDLSDAQKNDWLKIARMAESAPEGSTLKGTTTVNTLTMNRFGATSTPVILSIHSETKLKRKVWFNFWIIIFLIILFLSLPVLYFLDQNHVL